MYGQYRGREFTISCERVLDFGASQTRIEWTVKIDGEKVTPASLRPREWTLDALADAVRGLIDVIAEGASRV